MNSWFQCIRRIVGLSLIFAFGVCTAQAQAANLHLSIEYLQSYDAGLSPIGLPLLDPLAPVSPTDLHQFAVLMELSGILEDHDFQSVFFDVELGPGVSDFGWFISNATFDIPGPPPPTPIFTCGLICLPIEDLQNISVLGASRSIMAAVQPGENGPVSLGNFYVQWDGTAPSYVGVRPGGPLPSWSQFHPEAEIQIEIETFTVGPRFPLGVPEPSSLTLFAVAIVAVVGRYRHTA